MDLFEDSLNEEKLVEVTGEEDLSAVTYLEMEVDANVQSVYRLGEMLPKLRELKLNSSVVPSIRDLGTGVRYLRVLWLRSSGLEDLDGIGVLDLLEELYVSFNAIEDLTPLAFHDHLQVLDVESNRIDSVETLGSCAALRSLSLEGNPISRRDGYRQLVHHHLPGVELLDDAPVDSADRAPVDEDTLLASQMPLPSDDSADEEEPTGWRRPSLATTRASFSSSFASSVGPLSPSSPGPPSSPVADTGSSALTHGSGIVFAGNPVLAIRRRRAVLGDADPTLQQPRITPRRPSTASAGGRRRGRLLRTPSPFTVPDGVTEPPVARSTEIECDAVPGDAAAGPGSATASAESDAADPPSIDDAFKSFDARSRRFSSDSDGGSDLPPRPSTAAPALAWGSQRSAMASPSLLRASAASETLGFSSNRRTTSDGIVRPTAMGGAEVMNVEMEREKKEKERRRRGSETPPPMTSASLSPSPATFSPTLGFETTTAAASASAAADGGVPPTQQQQQQQHKQWMHQQKAQRQQQQQQRRRKESEEDHLGLRKHRPPAPPTLHAPLALPERAVLAEDKALVALLRRRPSEVAVIRSRDKYRHFFRGMSRERMERLLRAACATLGDDEREAKVAKRLALLEGVLAV